MIPTVWRDLEYSNQPRLLDCWHCQPRENSWRWYLESWTHFPVGAYSYIFLKDGQCIACHFDDYVLLWTGGGKDDVDKSPDMRGIANFVYQFLYPNDPTCWKFGVDKYRITNKRRQKEEEGLINTTSNPNPNTTAFVHTFY